MREIARFPHTWVNMGQVGRMVATLHADEQPAARHRRRRAPARPVEDPPRRRLLHQPAAHPRADGRRRRFRADERGALLRAEGPGRARRARGGARSAGRRRCASAAWRCPSRAAPMPGWALPYVPRWVRSMPARRWWWRTARCWPSKGPRAPMPCCRGWRVSPVAVGAGLRDGVSGQGAQARPGAARRHAGDRPAHRRCRRRRRPGGHRGASRGWCWSSTRRMRCARPMRRDVAVHGLPAERRPAAGARRGAAAHRAGDRAAAAEPPRRRRHREGARCRDRPGALRDGRVGGGGARLHPGRARRPRA